MLGRSGEIGLGEGWKKLFHTGHHYVHLRHQLSFPAVELSLIHICVILEGIRERRLEQQ